MSKKKEEKSKSQLRYEGYSIRQVIVNNKTYALVDGSFHQEIEIDY